MAEIVSVTIPQETVNDESVRIVSWKVASESIVEKGQLLCEVETSKAVIEIEAPVAGVVVYGANVGDEIPVGETICLIADEGATHLELASAQAMLSERAAVVPLVIPVSASYPVPRLVAEFVIQEADLPPARFSPVAAKLAAEFGFDIDSFPRGVLVRRDDVLLRAGMLHQQTIAKPTAAPAVTAAWPGDSEAAENAPVHGVGVEWTELPRRKVFEGRVLGQGRARTVQSSVTVSVNVQHLRTHMIRKWKTSVGLSALLIFEAARLLLKYPMFNAVHDRGRIGQYSDVNIGWAIDGGEGLMVPVISKADIKTLNEIIEIMTRQIGSYVEGTLSPADFLGGTFTISDLSSEGISHFHPLISQGQAAILGVSGEFAAVGGETLYLTLAFDHQLSEGRKAAQFVRELAGRLEVHAALRPAAVEAVPTSSVAMDRQQIESMVLEVLTAVLKCETDLNTSRQNTPQWDSLKHIEIIFSLEDKLGHRFSEEEMVRLNSVAEIVNVIRISHAT
jgi:pyruvate/2-oxoglutarate dehydrogenase complex dihydrolipoamide acyltransferase (E2) component/acyl carrier protein